MKFNKYSYLSRNNTDIDEEYYYEINSLISDIDFNTAEVKNSKIILYDSQNKQIQELVFNNYNDNIKIKNIHKENDIIFFVMSYAVDDEIGIMFVNNDSNIMMNGIKSIKRIGGNSYQYNTAE